ncbi:hypothetical protein [Ideonella sp.]|uniref:hypothetical protein n=1 Tax=Ideonella sp. TaxID=1929293 RepID=UPI002B498A75|nr:hypothetical protein [Ideonella sp.]HJV72558.1 hypothetical protein [Ideonella sp.]
MSHAPLALKIPQRLLAAAAALALLPAAHAASWKQLKHTPLHSVETMLLLTDGTVIAHSYDNPGNIWQRLTPSASGSYLTGTWSAITPMGTNRIYFASHVTPDGNVWVLGGEYSGPNLDANWTNTGETYDTLADSWSPIPHHPESNYGDVPSMLLEGSKILAGSLFNPTSFIYDLKKKTWTVSGNKLYADESSDEETWVKLPDGKVLTYDLFHSIATAGDYAEAYDPKTKTWASRSPSDGGATGDIPLLSSVAMGYELGGALTLRSADKRGDVFFAGATGHTATYQVGSNNWVPGPDIMGMLNGQKALFGADDAPAAELPNGHLVLAADAAPTKGLFQGPTQLFDYDPGLGKIKPIVPDFPVTIGDPAFVTRMLMLPTGQLMFTYGTTDVWIYTPDGKAPKKSRPLPEALHYDGSGVFTLTGRRMNGISAGSSYGDDAESDENYPIVSLTDGGGTVRYGRTYDWDNTQVQQKKPSTVKLTLKSGTPAGTHILTVSGAGVRSDDVCVTLTADEVAGTGAPADVPIGPCAQ